MSQRINQQQFEALKFLETRSGRNLRAVAEAVVARHRKPLAASEPGKATVDTFVIRQQPIGKPRMTRRDTWKKRPVVVRYREWADEARRQINPASLPLAPISLTIRAFFAMPASWSKRKQAEMAGKPHRQKPDWDNIGKAVQDIFWKDDQVVAEGHVLKFWDDGNGARVEMEVK